MPSEEEIRELLRKAREYVNTYKESFISSKSSLDKAVPAGFYAKGIELSSQALAAITAIDKNGSSAYGLVGLIAILDDMSLNGARASAATMLVAVQESSSDPKNHAANDLLNLAQAEKNCYDISELLLHATLRYISVQEAALRRLLSDPKP